MELPALHSIYFLTSLLLILLLSIRFLQKQATNSKSNLPPGPKTLPFIGSLHHLATGSLPHHTLRNLAQLHGPIMLLRAGEIDLVVITSREAAKEVMQTQDENVANRPVLCAANVVMYGSMGIGFSNGPYWRQVRRICTSELFSSKQVKSFSSIRKEEINYLLKSFTLFSGNSPVNLSARTIELSNNIIIRAAFGGKCKMRGMFLEALRDVVEILSGFYLSDFFPSLSWLDVKMRRRVARLHRTLDLVLDDIVQEHLKNQQQQKKREDQEEIEYDFVDVLINVKERGDLEVPLTMDNIKAIILDVFIGGTDTSATVITWAMTELMKYPEVMAKAQTEIRQAASDNTNFDVNTLSYLQLVIKETLRMHPPGPLIPRLCKESCQVLGYTIPCGARLLVNNWALGRDPDYWNNPYEFKPERFEMSAIDFKGKNFEFVPFGAGRRICPGIKFGMANVEEALVSLLLHFDWKLPDGLKPEDVDMTETFGLGAAKKEPLYLVPTLQVPLPDA